MVKQRKRLFVAMPYGIREGSLDHTKPHELTTINFDSVWEEMLEPTVPKGRFEAKRADTTGKLGLIDRVYIEWLVESEVVLADLTFGNPNVYYELGIRHALSERGAVLIAQRGTVPPFDLRNQAILNYDIWNAGSFLKFQKTLRDAIHEAETDPSISPVHVFMPGLYVKNYENGKNPDRELRSLREQSLEMQGRLEELQLDRTQRLIDKIKEADGRSRLRSLAHQIQQSDAVSIRVLEILAARLRQAELFDEAIAALERAVSVDGSDPELQRELGFAYRLKGPAYHDRARQYFESALAVNDADGELNGLIGGMLKREGRLEEAREHYQRAYDLDPTDLYGVVTMGEICAATQSPEFRQYYGEVLALCDAAVSRDEPDHWTYFCRGEAHLVLGDGESARMDYSIAVGLHPPRADVRSAAEALGFLANHDVERENAASIQELILWPSIQDAE